MKVFGMSLIIFYALGIILYYVAKIIKIAAMCFMFKFHTVKMLWNNFWTINIHPKDKNVF